MKKTILTAACAMAAIGTFAQGTITMSNNNDIFAPGGTVDLGPASGGTYVAELVEVPGGEVASSICPVNAGFFFGPAATSGLVTVNVAPGAALTYQIEVWDTAYASSYAAALGVSTPGSLAGISQPFTENVNSALPAPPNTGINFPSFSVSQTPEPTTLALGALGAASLFLIRRRK
jgi:hypothetical protein